MGTLSTIIETVEERLNVLGFQATREVFDFNTVPDSVINKAYRIQTKNISNQALSGNRVMASWALEIYVAYKEKRNARTAFGLAHDDREVIENDLMNSAALMGLAVVLMDQESSAEKYLDAIGYLVSKTVVRCDFIRTLTTS